MLLQSQAPKLTVKVHLVPGTLSALFRDHQLVFSRSYKGHTTQDQSYCYTPIHRTLRQLPAREAMSPILKRDVAETIRQARRLATIAAGGRPDPDGEHDKSYKDADNGRGAGGSWRRPDDLEEHGSYGSGADRRQGIGVENGDVGWIPSVHTEGSVERKNVDEGIARGSVEGRRWEGGWTREQEAGEGETETERMLGEGDVGRVGGMEYEEVDLPVASGRQGQMQDLKNLLFEVSYGLY